MTNPHAEEVFVSMNEDAVAQMSVMTGLPRKDIRGMWLEDFIGWLHLGGGHLVFEDHGTVVWDSRVVYAGWFE